MTEKWQWLDPAAESERWRARETCALLLWFAVGGFAVAQHVSWADEAQAWLLAQGSSWMGLFTHALHYEGEGGLWHAFLKVLQALHVSFAGMHWAALAVQGAAMALLLRWAPFPRAARLLLPFMFFLLYQDAVVARSYCLYAVLAFAAAALLRGTRPRPLVLVCVLGPLAMLSVHGVVLSAGLAIVAAVRWHGAARGRVVAAGLVLLAFWIATAAIMSPAADIDFPAGNNLRRSFSKVERAFGLHPAPAPPSVAALPKYGLPAPAEVVHVRKGVKSTLHRGARLLGVVTYPLSSSRALALLLVAAVLLQGALTRHSDAAAGMSGLVPYALMVTVFSSLYMQPRHAGTLLTAFLVSAWLTWPSRGELALDRRARLLTRTAAALLLLVALIQIGWTAEAIGRERRVPYAPSRMTATFLRSRGVSDMPGGPRAAGFYYYSIQPLVFFNHNIYMNQPPHRFWLWSTSTDNYETVEQVLAVHPAIVVVSGATAGPDSEITRDWQPNTPPLPGVVRGDGFHVADFFAGHGYRITHVFCGYRGMRATYDEQLCDTILEPADDKPAR